MKLPNLDEKVHGYDWKVFFIPKNGWLKKYNGSWNFKLFFPKATKNNVMEEKVYVMDKKLFLKTRRQFEVKTSARKV